MKNSQIKTVVITGASTGIGRGLAEKFANQGYKVALLARREEIITKIAIEIKQNGGNAIAIKCNVDNKDSVQSAIKKVQDTWGYISMLIANAGISLSSPNYEINSEIYEKVFQTNVLGALYSFEAVIPIMLKQQYGHLVGISSLASYRALPGSGAYSSSKAALSAIVESLRLDLKPRGITVSLINPGFIKTPLTAKNLYPMPFLMETAAGVNSIYKAIVRKKAIHAFPWPMAFAARLGRLLPPFIYDKLVAKHKNIKL